jgi:hypothetical protein
MSKIEVLTSLVGLAKKIAVKERVRKINIKD